MADAIPTTMQALELRTTDGGPEALAFAEVPVPRPGRGEVLVKVAAAPVNPSDLMFLKGLYGVSRPLPTVPGFEGAGTVVASGGGLAARLLQGRRVAVAASERGGGTWAEYVCVPAAHAVPLRRQVGFEQGATLIVNPLTAWAIVSIARRGGHRALVQTAAASALGRMVVRLARRRGIETVNVVRRAEQAELLRDDGVEHVLDSSSPAFASDLERTCRSLVVSLAFDAVAGESTSALARALPAGARIVVYGALSEAACQLHPGDLIFRGVSVEGLWLSRWLRAQSPIKRLLLARRVQRLLGDDLATAVRERVRLRHGKDAILRYAAAMSGGKVLLIP